jgi:hypothetical protein
VNCAPVLLTEYPVVLLLALLLLLQLVYQG